MEFADGQDSEEPTGVCLIVGRGWKCHIMHLDYVQKNEAGVRPFLTRKEFLHSNGSVGLPASTWQLGEGWLRREQKPETLINQTGQPNQITGAQKKEGKTLKNQLSKNEGFALGPCRIIFLRLQNRWQTEWKSQLWAILYAQRIMLKKYDDEWNG